MQDVAARAGVALKTVSRVINGEANVSARMEARVRTAIEELGYEPDVIAGNLRRLDRRTFSIGLLVGSSDNPFSTSLARAVEIVAFDHQTVVLSSSLHMDPSREREVVSALLRRRIDGLLLTTATHSLDVVTAAQERGLSIVYVDGPALGIEADAVFSDNAGGARLATRHLLEGGHRRIAYLGARKDVHTIAERRAGYLAELASWNVDADPALIIDDADEESAETAARALVEAGAQAIFCAQNLCTIGAVRGLHAIEAQHQVAVVAFDDIETGDILDPGLTVVRQDPAEMGRIAAEKLFQRVHGHTGVVTTTVLPVRLVTRGSGEIAPQK
ncbi:MULTISPECIES: LacI family DNA-binding transcriptional regulator [unclassified Microbacterium]|uniref:LacI family DNA-binding transcriptional regulator n=1 Tax=unclassified Microbacterium TaxID=2609290 RepID=UPI00301A9F16